MGSQDRREAEGADSAAAVRGGDPGGDRDQGDRARDRPPASQGRDRQVLRRRRHSQAQVAREAEGGKETDEAGRDRGDTSGSVPRSAPGGVGGLMRWILAAGGSLSVFASPAPFTLKQVRSYPFPNELTAAATGSLRERTVGRVRARRRSRVQLGRWAPGQCRLESRRAEGADLQCHLRWRRSETARRRR